MTAGGASSSTLRAAMEAALERLPPTDESPPHRLARAGLAAVEEVIAGAGERSSAVDLLAADALLTAACQAAAAEGPAALDSLLRTLGTERFQAMLPGEGPA